MRLGWLVLAPEGRWREGMTKLHREKCSPPTPDPPDSSRSLQMQEMREGLTGGKPLLGNGEIFPAGEVNVPGHPRRDLIGGVFSSGKDGEDFLHPDPVVLLEFLDSPTRIRDGIPMPR